MSAQMTEGPADEQPWNFERAGETIEPVTAESILHSWDLSVIKENIKRIWAAMHGDDRGPLDYDVKRDERRALVSVLRDLLKEIRSRPPPSMNNGDDSNGVKKWVAGVGAVLSTAFIIAAWTVSNEVAKQGAKIDYVIEQQREQNARITRIEQQGNERR
jgi:hypothetical protein